jgi:hypothetical protein
MAFFVALAGSCCHVYLGVGEKCMHKYLNLVLQSCVVFGIDNIGNVVFAPVKPSFWMTKRASVLNQNATCRLWHGVCRTGGPSGCQLSAGIR